MLPPIQKVGSIRWWCREFPINSPHSPPLTRLLNVLLHFITEKVLILVQPAGHDAHLAGIQDTKLIEERQLRIFIFLDVLPDLFPHLGNSIMCLGR